MISKSKFVSRTITIGCFKAIREATDSGDNVQQQKQQNPRQKCVRRLTSGSVKRIKNNKFHIQTLYQENVMKILVLVLAF